LSQTLDPRELRNAFGCFATGVTIVTALDTAGAPVGITANSFTSLPLDPPLVLWSVGRQSQTFDTFSTTSAFVVSVLEVNAAPLSSRFAMHGGHKVDSMETIPTELGPPTFADVLAVFECETYARYEGGDHVIVVGRIKRFTRIPDTGRKGPRPLLYYRGRYGTLAEFSG
jgi:flavin reductase (DIM6/NTAB) family NADH-FMN oxidoreductase RutF